MLATVASYVRISQFEEPATVPGASLLEIQRLMYFLQERGQPLCLNYMKARYGPYADNLNHALEPLEGHYLRGYGDRTQQVLKLSPITLIPGAADEAREWIETHSDDGTADRISAVSELVTGFASAYGVELLATVHWTATREAAAGPNERAACSPRPMSARRSAASKSSGGLGSNPESVGRFRGFRIAYPHSS